VADEGAKTLRDPLRLNGTDSKEDAMTRVVIAARGRRMVVVVVVVIETPVQRKICPQGKKMVKDEVAGLTLNDISVGGLSEVSLFSDVRRHFRIFG